MKKLEKQMKNTQNSVIKKKRNINDLKKENNKKVEHAVYASKKSV